MRRLSLLFLPYSRTRPERWRCRKCAPGPPEIESSRRLDGERKYLMKAIVKQQPPASSQFLTFLLDEREYGLELFKIQEIRGFVPVTPIPNVPPHVRGVMNLRGTVLPVVDLRMKFRLPPIEYNKFTVIVIAMVGEKMVGLLVDAVSDVLQVAQESIRDAPNFGSAVDTRFIDGVFQTRERLAIALNLEKLLSDIELGVPQADNA